jgi:hypothetical protein
MHVPPCIINSAGGKYAVRKFGGKPDRAGLFSVDDSVGCKEGGEPENFFEVFWAGEMGSK